MQSQPEVDDVANKLARDIAIGLVLTYATTVVLCLLALDGDLKTALLASLVPGVVAGPLVGGLIALRRYLAVPSPY